MRKKQRLLLWNTLLTSGEMLEFVSWSVETVRKDVCRWGHSVWVLVVLMFRPLFTKRGGASLFCQSQGNKVKLQSPAHETWMLDRAAVFWFHSLSQVPPWRGCQSHRTPTGLQLTWLQEEVGEAGENPRRLKPGSTCFLHHWCFCSVAACWAFREFIHVRQLSPSP